MAGLTNTGKLRLLELALRNEWNGEATNIPTAYKLALVTDTTISETNVYFSDLTEIAAGNGYTAGGSSVARDDTDFDACAIEDAALLAYFQIKDMEWTASGGSIPDSGDGAHAAVLVDDQAAPEIIWYWVFTAEQSVGDGAKLSLIDLEGRLKTDDTTVTT